MYTFKKKFAAEFVNRVVVNIEYGHKNHDTGVISRSSEEAYIPYENWEKELNLFLIEFNKISEEINKINSNNTFTSESLISVDVSNSTLKIPLNRNFNDTKFLAPMKIFEIEHYDSEGVRSLIEYTLLSEKINNF
jgi:hypothetical protein